MNPKEGQISRRRMLQVSGAAVAAGLIGTTALGHTHRGPLGPEQERLMTNNQSNPKPTVVLVHGAFADASGFGDIMSTLYALGYPVVAPPNPLRGVKSDTNYLARTLASLNGPLVLVGHSYGGMTITGAAEGNANVKGLVYIAGFAPEPGETAAELSTKFPGSTLTPTLAPPVALGDGTTDLYIQQDKYYAQFCADVSESVARNMAATQRPATNLAFSETVSSAAWKTLPSWFVWGELDRNIPVASHQFMADRAKAREAQEVKGASHVVFMTHADTVANIIVKAATESVLAQV